jgi:two-component system sensor histidine kinase PilS (NtrC family)
MGSPDLKATRQELVSRLQRLMFLRVVVISFLLGASVFIQVRQTRTYFGDLQTTHYALIVSIYFLTLVYVILLKTLKDLIKLAYGQLLVDTLLVTAIIYATGGIESIFSFLYMLVIINGSILLYRRGGMIIASVSSILYGTLLDLHYFGMIEPLGSRLAQPSAYHGAYLFYTVAVNIAAFYLVAFLSSYATEQARKSKVELKARQADIVKLEALNEWIVRSIRSGLITLDDQGRIISFNPAAEEMFGILSEAVIGKSAGDVLPFIKEPIQDRLNGTKLGQDEFIDLSYQRANGEKLFLRCSISPLNLPEGGHGGHILFFQDLTAMKQIEEEMRKVEGLAMAGQLAAGIAHEIRNPMASISGSIQILKESLDKDDINGQLMDIILREINRLNDLLSDFLLFARPKQAKLEWFDLNELILESLDFFRNSGKWVDKIRVHTKFHTPLRLESDPYQVRQVLWNLLLNASEAMPDGGSLYIQTELFDSKGGRGNRNKQVRMTIRDTGKGFTEDAIKHLFTPFFTTKEGGSGLGLAIVKRIVEGLKGWVYGKNHSEGGAEVTILLSTTFSS